MPPPPPRKPTPQPRRRGATSNSASDFQAIITIKDRNDQLPSYGSFNESIGPPYLSPDGPARLSQDRHAAAQLLFRADPSGGLFIWIQGLVNLGLDDFSDIEDLAAYDLRLIPNLSRDNRLRIAFALRHFASAHAGPPQNDSCEGRDVNETLSNLHFIAFDMPLSMRPARDDCFWASSPEEDVVSNGFVGCTLRHPRAPLSTQADGSQVAELLFIGAWVVVQLEEYIEDGSLSVSFHDGTTRVFTPQSIDARLRGCAQDMTLGVSISTQRKAQQRFARMSTWGGHSTERVAQAYPPMKTALELDVPCCMASGCRAPASKISHPQRVAMDKLAAASSAHILSDGHGIFCICHRIQYLGKGARQWTWTHHGHHQWAPIVMAFNGGFRRPTRYVLCLGGTDDWIFLSDSGHTVALRRSEYGEQIFIDNWFYDTEVPRRWPDWPKRDGEPSFHTPKWRCDACDVFVSGQSCSCPICGAPEPGEPQGPWARAARSSREQLGQFDRRAAARNTLSANALTFVPKVMEDYFHNYTGGGLTSAARTSSSSRRLDLRQEDAGESKSAVHERESKEPDERRAHDKNAVFFWNSEHPNFAFSNWAVVPGGITFRHTKVCPEAFGTGHFTVDKWGTSRVYGFESLMGHGKSSVDAWDTYTVPTAEHYIMMAKASFHEDWLIFFDVLKASTAEDAKGLGRLVANFKESEWSHIRPLVLYEATKAKFTQSHELRPLLLATGQRMLVEASPFDKVYGAGFSPDEIGDKHPLQWTGANLLGDTLVRVRGMLKAEGVDPTHAHLVEPIAMVVDLEDPETYFDKIESLDYTKFPPRAKDIEQIAKAARHAFLVLLLTPSCTPFSGASDVNDQATGQLGSNRKDCHLDIAADSIIRAQPFAAILENVADMLQHSAWKAARSKLEDAGFTVQEHIMFSTFLGLPNMRRRAIIVITPGIIPDFLSPTMDRINACGVLPEHRRGVRDVEPGLRFFYAHRRRTKFRGVWTGDSPVAATLTSCLRPPSTTETPHASDASPLALATVLRGRTLKVTQGLPYSWALPPAGEHCTECAACNPRVLLQGRALGNLVCPEYIFVCVRQLMSYAESITSDVTFIGVDLFCGNGGGRHGARRAGLPMKLAFDICPWAVLYYNINAAMLHDDPYENGMLRSVVRGVPLITYDHAGLPRMIISSIVVTLGPGRIGAAFVGGAWSSNRWEVCALPHTAGRAGTLESVGVQVGMRLTHINGIDAQTIPFPGPLEERRFDTGLTFAYRQADLAAPAVTGWHGHPLPKRCILHGCNSEVFNGHEFCRRAHAGHHGTWLKVNDKPICADPGCSKSAYYRPPSSIALTTSAHSAAQAACASRYCSPACAAPCPSPGQLNWHGHQAPERCIITSCSQKCHPGSDTCTRGHTSTWRKTLAAAMVPLCRKSDCMRASWHLSLNDGDPRRSAYCSENCMQEDANFDLAILADQAVRAEVSTPPLSMPDIEHIAIHDRGDVERRPKRTLDFNSLASGPTTTNVAEDVGAAVTMDVDTEPPTQAAARSSSSDVPSNERADWLNNGPARARRAAVVSTARVAREVLVDAGESVPLTPDDDYDDGQNSCFSDVTSEEDDDILSSFDGSVSAIGYMAGNGALMPGPYLSARATDASRSGTAPTTEPRMAIYATGADVQLHPLPPQGVIAIAQGDIDGMVDEDDEEMVDGDSDVDVDEPDIERIELDLYAELPPKEPPPSLPPPKPLPPEPDLFYKNQLRFSNQLAKKARIAAARATLAAKHARRAAFTAERHAHAWSRLNADSKCVGTAIPTHIHLSRLRHLQRGTAAVYTRRDMSAVGRALATHDKRANSINKAPSTPQPQFTAWSSRVPDPALTRGHIHIQGLCRTERKRLAAQMETELRDDGTCRDLFEPLWSSLPTSAPPSDTDPAAMYAHAPPRHQDASSETHPCRVSQRHARWKILHMAHCSRCQSFSRLKHFSPPPISWMRRAWSTSDTSPSTSWSLDPDCYQHRLLEDLRCGFDPQPARPIRACVRSNGPSCWNEHEAMDKYMEKMESVPSMSDGQWSLPVGAVLSAMHCVARASDVRHHERNPSFEVPVRVVNDFTASGVNSSFDSWRFRMGGINAAIGRMSSSTSLSLGSVDIRKMFPSLPLGKQMQLVSWLRDPRAETRWQGTGSPPPSWITRQRQRRLRHGRTPPFRRWTGVPLGFKLSPAFACSTSAEIVQFLAAIGITVVSYVDDFLIIALNHTQCAEHIHTVIKVIEWLGFRHSPEKTEGPACSLAFLGLFFDPINRRVTVTKERRIALKEDVSRLLSSVSFGLKDLESLLGKLGFISSICRGGNAFLQRLRHTFNIATKTSSRRVNIDIGARADAEWWLHTLSGEIVGSRICMMDELPVVLTAKSDASGSMGFGYLFGDVVHFSRFSDSTASSLHIGCKELLPLVHMAEEYGHLLRGKLVRCGVDNVGVVYSTLKGSSRCFKTQALLRRLASAQIRHQFDIISCHVSRTYNTASDMLTRFADMQEVDAALPDGVSVSNHSGWGRCTNNSPSANEPVFFATLLRQGATTSPTAPEPDTNAKHLCSSTSATACDYQGNSDISKWQPSSSGTADHWTSQTQACKVSSPLGAVSRTSVASSSQAPTRASSNAFGNSSVARKCATPTRCGATHRSLSAFSPTWPKH